jgi:Family of unknown function (DUF5691)
MSESVRQALTLGLSRCAGFEPSIELAPHLPGRTAADALRALAANRVLLEAARIPIQLEAVAIAPEESQPLPRQGAATLLQIIFSSEPWLTDEALEVLHARGLRLPHAALLAMLGAQERSLKTRIARVAGERGRWLAKSLGDYSWLLQTPQSSDVETLKRTFQEGQLVEREAALREWRSIDAGAARECVSANFAQDKADVRVRLLAALEPGLSLADEPFLAGLLNDRAASVQTAARVLLLKLPESALRGRNRQLLAGCVSSRSGELVIDLPSAWPPALATDGLLAPPKDHASPKAFMIRSLASVTPPQEWLAITQLAPAAFVDALYAQPFFFEIVDAWMQADVAFAALAKPLLLALRAERAKPEFAKRSYQQKQEWLYLERQLLTQLSVPDWETLWPQLVRERSQYDGLYEQLPRPWPASIAAAWLNWLAEFLRQRAPEPNAPVSNAGTINYELNDVLRAARAGLPPTHFEQAFALLPPEQHPCFDPINEFLRALELRARIYSEFRLPDQALPQDSHS